MSTALQTTTADMNRDEWHSFLACNPAFADPETSFLSSFSLHQRCACFLKCACVWGWNQNQASVAPCAERLWFRVTVESWTALWVRTNRIGNKGRSVALKSQCVSFGNNNTQRWIDLDWSKAGRFTLHDLVFPFRYPEALSSEFSFICCLTGSLWCTSINIVWQLNMPLCSLNENKWTRIGFTFYVAPNGLTFLIFMSLCKLT